MSEEDRVRLARMGTKAVSLTLKGMGLPHGKTITNSPKKNAVQRTNFSIQSHYKFPEFRKPILAAKKISAETIAKANVQPVQSEPRVAPQPAVQEIEMTREESFSCTMDILLEGMEGIDKASKEAAKNLLIVMGNETGNSVSLLVYNSYVRKYNSLREQYFLSAAANLKAKTIRLRDDILQSIEQMSKTIKINMPPVLNMSPRRI